MFSSELNNTLVTAIVTTVLSSILIIWCSKSIINYYSKAIIHAKIVDVSCNGTHLSPKESSSKQSSSNEDSCNLILNIKNKKVTYRDVFIKQPKINDTLTLLYDKQHPYDTSKYEKYSSLHILSFILICIATILILAVWGSFYNVKHNRINATNLNIYSTFMANKTLKKK